MKYSTQSLLCKLGCQYCINFESCDLYDCDCDNCSVDEEEEECDDCEGVNKQNENCDECCSSANKSANCPSKLKNMYPKGHCRHCGGRDEYAYVSGGDGMICCWLCKSEGRG